MHHQTVRTARRSLGLTCLLTAVVAAGWPQEAAAQRNRGGGANARAAAEAEAARAAAVARAIEAARQQELARVRALEAARAQEAARAAAAASAARSPGASRPQGAGSRPGNAPPDRTPPAVGPPQGQPGLRPPAPVRVDRNPAERTGSAQGQPATRSSVGSLPDTRKSGPKPAPEAGKALKRQPNINEGKEQFVGKANGPKDVKVARTTPLDIDLSKHAGKKALNALQTALKDVKPPRPAVGLDSDSRPISVSLPNGNHLHKRLKQINAILDAQTDSKDGINTPIVVDVTGKHQNRTIHRLAKALGKSNEDAPNNGDTVQFLKDGNPPTKKADQAAIPIK